MKKALSLILVLVMLLGMMPMTAFATEGTQETEVVHEHDYEAGVQMLIALLENITADVIAGM